MRNLGADIIMASELRLASTGRTYDRNRQRAVASQSACQAGPSTYAGVFGSEARSDPATPPVDVKTLHAKIGELTLSNDFLSGALSKAGLLSAKR